MVVCQILFHIWLDNSLHNDKNKFYGGYESEDVLFYYLLRHSSSPLYKKKKKKTCFNLLKGRCGIDTEGRINRALNVLK